MDALIAATLASLRPTHRHAVMDLVAQAGIDVGPWAVKRDGTPVRKPRENPAYCYDWAFGSDAEGYVLCIWHDSLGEVVLPQGAALAFQENVRQLALSLDRIAIDRTQPSDIRNRARDQAGRARKFESALQRSFRKQLAVRVIVNEGDQRADDELGTSKSTVKLRALDDARWFVHRYDDAMGDALLVRGIELPGVAGTPADVVLDQESPTTNMSVAGQPPGDKAASPAVPPTYVDQFSEPAAVAAREATVLLRDRSAAVRARVLARSEGRCELCARPGFLTAAGSIYLETHHVLPLAEDGPDHESNVVALCPEDHRRAHYGAERLAMAERLSALLRERFPA
ncbi:MAG: HNH endonuclease [Burkholderiaceae bacterium]|nr:MAG: HNH endonuclease [Burkholderiaceae bacterium]